MIVAVDETGSFRDAKGKNFGIVTLVTVTDNEWEKFSQFMDNFFPNGFIGKKGKDFTDRQLDNVLKYIGSKQEIRFSAFLYDLASGNDKWVNYHKQEPVKRTEEKIELMRSKLKKSYVLDIKLYLNQLKKYSVGDYAKFVMFTELFIEWQRFFQFDYVFTNERNDSWRMHHIIDTQNQPGKFIRLIQSTLILTTSELNPNYGIYTPKEWSKDHPFILYHSKDGDIQRHNAKRFYEDFKIGNEKDEGPLLLPDLIGYIIMTSIRKRYEKRWLKRLKRLYSNRSWTIKNKHKEGYYHITGFDKLRDPRDVNLSVREHYHLMKNYNKKC